MFDLGAHLITTDENVDIAITVIKILEELTDEDVGDGVEDEEGFLEALTQLVKGLVRRDSYSDHLLRAC